MGRKGVGFRSGILYCLGGDVYVGDGVVGLVFGGAWVIGRCAGGMLCFERFPGC